jgi:hypothetical protein
VTWHGVFGQLDAVTRGEPRLQRRRAVAAREQLARLRDELVRAGGARRDELRAAVEDAEIVEREAWIAELASVHHEATPRIDWRAVAAIPPPFLPAVDQARSREARRRLLDYRPDAFALLDRRRTLKADVERLIAAEEAERAATMGQWREEIWGWEAWCSLTARVLCSDITAYREVIDASGCLAEIHEVIDRERVRIELTPSTAEVDVQVDLPRRDELAARAPELARDYAHAAPLRIARELLAALPIERVVLRVATSAGTLAPLSMLRARSEAIDWLQGNPRDIVETLT